MQLIVQTNPSSQWTQEKHNATMLMGSNPKNQDFLKLGLFYSSPFYLLKNTNRRYAFFMAKGV